MFGSKKYKDLQKRALELSDAMGQRPTIAEITQLKDVLEELAEAGDWSAHKSLANLYGKSIWVALDYGKTDIELASPDRKAEILNYATLGLLQLKIFTERGGRKIDADMEANVERYREEFVKSVEATRPVGAG